MIINNDIIVNFNRKNALKILNLIKQVSLKNVVQLVLHLVMNVLKLEKISVKLVYLLIYYGIDFVY